MTEDEADRKLALAVRFHGGRSFETTVASSSVEAMVRAAGRAGLRAAADPVSGRVRVSEPPVPEPDDREPDDREASGREARGLTRRLYARGLGARAIDEAIGAAPEEGGHLRAGRFGRVGAERARALLAGLRA